MRYIMELREPKLTEYKSKLQMAKDLMSEIVPGITTAVGSSIYEFVLRPACILYSSILDAINKTYNDYSLAKLSTSDNTSTGVADDIMSNYFITRKSGKHAKAVVVIYSSLESTRVPQGAVLSANGVRLTTTTAIYGVYPKANTVNNNEAIKYVDAYKVKEGYCFNVDVETLDVTETIIPSGVSVDTLTNIPGFIRSELVSPIEGGSLGESDADMVRRARYMVCSWDGGSNSIHKVLMQSGIPVLSSYSFDDRDPEMTRVSGSSVFIGTGGMVDTYVKTCEYPLSSSCVIHDVTGRSIDITKYIPSGTLSIDKVTDGEGALMSYTVEWGSSAPNITNKGARFSVYQTTVINLTSDITGSIVVHYTYIPYIKELQDYIDRPDVRIIGSDIVIKSAIPVKVTVRGSITANNSSTDNIKGCIKNFINKTEVGSYSINYADIHQYVSDNTNGSYLSDPVYLSYITINADGEWVVTDKSATGSLYGLSSEDITPRMSFFCVCDEEVIIE